MRERLPSPVLYGIGNDASINHWRWICRDAPSTESTAPFAASNRSSTPNRFITRWAHHRRQSESRGANPMHADLVSKERSSADARPTEQLRAARPITSAITGRRRKIFHFSPLSFADPVHRIVTRDSAWSAVNVRTARGGLGCAKFFENAMDFKVNIRTELVTNLFDFFNRVESHRMIPAIVQVYIWSKGQSPTRGRCGRSAVVGVD